MTELFQAIFKVQSTFKQYYDINKSKKLNILNGRTVVRTLVYCCYTKLRLILHYSTSSFNKLKWLIHFYRNVLFLKLIAITEI